MAKIHKKILGGANVGVSIVVFLAILTAIVLIAQGHPYRVDLTKGQKHSLSPQTIKIVKGLKDPIEIKAFYQDSQAEKAETQGLLNAYKYQSPKISFTFIDPDRQPAITRQFDVKTYGTLVLVGYGKKETVTMPDERTITRAILRLTSKKKKTVYFVTGHGERAIADREKSGYSGLKEALEKANYVVKDLNLALSAVPKDASTVVIADPKKPLFKEEISALEDYLDNGGRVLVLLSPFDDGGLTDFLKTYGYDISNDIVIDQVSRMFGGDYLIPVINSYGHHEISEDFNLMSFFPLARSIGQEKKLPEGVSIQMLAETSNQSWAETNQEDLNKGKAEFNEKEDKKGPVIVAAIATISENFQKQDAPKAAATEEKAGDSEKKGETDKPEQAAKTEKPKENNQPGQLAVFGSADLAANAYLGASGNTDLVLNTISFLARDSEQISIRPKAPQMDNLMLTPLQGSLLFWISLVCVPLLVLASGFVAYRIRRKCK